MITKKFFLRGPVKRCKFWYCAFYDGDGVYVDEAGRTYFDGHLEQFIYPVSSAERYFVVKKYGLSENNEDEETPFRRAVSNAIKQGKYLPIEK